MKSLIILFSVLLLVLMPVALVVGCQQELEPAPITEPESPTNFTTYTSEGLFSISYPEDWAPVTSLIGEIEEEHKEWILSIDPESEIEESEILFVAGKPDTEGFYPSVSISVTTRSTGYYTLDEIVESETLWNREYLQRYKVHSQTRTIIDGREAEIVSDEDYEPEYGFWRYVGLFMVKGDLVWFVECGCESEDFNAYEDIFNSVVRSIHILN